MRATFVNEPFDVGHGKTCVGLKVPVLGLVTVPSAAGAPPSKASVTFTVLFTS
jgi:hypothetical protein